MELLRGVNSLENDFRAAAPFFSSLEFHIFFRHNI